MIKLSAFLVLLLHLRVSCAQAANSTACSWALGDQMGSGGGIFMFFIGWIPGALLASFAWWLSTLYGPKAQKESGGGGWHLPAWHLPSWHSQTGPGRYQPVPDHPQPGPAPGPAPGQYPLQPGQDQWGMPPGQPPPGSAAGSMGWYYPGMGLAGYRTEYDVVPSRA